MRLEGDARVADAAEPSLRGEWRALLLLAVWFVAAAVAVGAHRNVPVIDDWTYAWSVERMLRDGRFEVLDWSAVFPVGHVMWGTLWSLAFGFSFVTLRLSTLALALVASGALYFILRELEAPPRIALLGALSVASNPVLLLLSSSFMTDVPFVAFTLLAILCYVRAMRRGRASLVWWGGAWAFAAFLDRQIGVLTPLAALPLLVHRGQPGALKRSSVVLAMAVTWGAMLVFSLLLITLLRPTGEMSKLVERLSYVLQIPAATYLRLQPLRPQHHCVQCTAGVARDGQLPGSVAQGHAVRAAAGARRNHDGAHRRDPGAAPARRHVDALGDRRQPRPDSRHARAVDTRGDRNRPAGAGLASHRRSP